MGAIRLRDEDLAQDCCGSSSARPRLEGSLAELGNVSRGSVIAGPGITVGGRQVRHLVIGHGLGIGVSRSLGQGLSLGVSRRLGQGLGQLPLGGTLTLLTTRASGGPDRRRAGPGSPRAVPGAVLMADSLSRRGVLPAQARDRVAAEEHRRAGGSGLSGPASVGRLTIQVGAKPPPKAAAALGAGWAGSSVGPGLPVRSACANLACARMAA